MSEFKTIPAYVKTVDNEQGIVTHLISVYDIQDYGRDIAHKGMFTKTLQERMGRIRVIDNHQQGSISHVIGKPIDLYEVGRDKLPQKVLQMYPTATGGLMAETQFLMDTPEGEGAFKRIKAEAVTEFSFAYDTIQADSEKINGTKVRHLREVRLYEYGPVIFGMNDAAVAISAKAEETEESKTEAELWFEQKETGYIRRAQSIRDAFYAKTWDSGDTGDTEVSGKSEWFYVSEIFDDYVLVETYGKEVFFQVSYSEESDGSFTFAEKSEWVVGTLEFAATEMMEEADAAEEGTSEDTSMKRRLLPILIAELEMLDIEVGPIDTKADAEVDAETKADADAEPDADAAPESKSPNVDTDVDPDVDTDVDPDPDTKDED